MTGRSEQRPLDDEPRTAAQATVAALDRWRRDWRTAQARGADTAELQGLLDTLARALTVQSAAAADRDRRAVRVPETSTRD